MCILLVEDDYNDVLLIERAWRKASIEQTMLQVSDGDEAIAYLDREGKYADMQAYPSPTLLLLDLKLPRCSGLELLSWIRQHPKHRRLLIVVLTSSQENSDLDRAYDLGINSYLLKPLRFQDFVKLVELVDAYWFHLNQPPKISWGEA